MDDKFKFAYEVTQETQLTFEGTARITNVFGEGHILYQGHLMCGKSLSKTKKKMSIVSQRKEGKKLCPACQEKYKKNPDSDWQKWVNGFAKDAGKSREVAAI